MVSDFNYLEVLTESLNGGGERIRTDDPLLAKQVLYQLSYTPQKQDSLIVSNFYSEIMSLTQDEILTFALYG